MSSRDTSPRRYSVGKRLGLIIGINEYQHPAFRPLQFAENDARALAQWLVNVRGGKWAPSDLQLLLGAQATSRLAEAHIMQLCANVAEPGDLLFLYFAGHAFLDESNGDGYLAFANTHYQQPATGLHLPTLVRQAMILSRASAVARLLPNRIYLEYATNLAIRFQTLARSNAAKRSATNTRTFALLLMQGK
jgi:Caspase domain